VITTKLKGEPRGGLSQQKQEAQLSQKDRATQCVS